MPLQKVHRREAGYVCNRIVTLFDEENFQDVRLALIFMVVDPDNQLQRFLKGALEGRGCSTPFRITEDHKPSFGAGQFHCAVQYVIQQLVWFPRRAHDAVDLQEPLETPDRCRITTGGDGETSRLIAIRRDGIMLQPSLRLTDLTVDVSEGIAVILVRRGAVVVFAH